MSTNILKLQTKFKFAIYLFLLLFTCPLCADEFCHTQSQCTENFLPNKNRFLLYDVNPPEGFNLRRDVYIRFAILARKLSLSKNQNLKNFKLVLPPWSRLYHWSYSPEPEHIPWSLFFDFDSLKSFAPVIEMHEFFHVINKTYSVVIDEVYVLQHFKDMFETGNFEDRMKIDACEQPPQVKYFYYNNVTSNNVKCLSYHGPATKLSKLLDKSPAKIILFHHSEVALHDTFGSKLYWECRRSMRFSKDLQKIATDFTRKFLDLSDEDETVLPDKWREEKGHRNARGGPYLAVHLRRRDFLRGRSDQVPSVEHIAKQITETLKKLNLLNVFIASDTSEKEFAEIITKVPSNFRVIRYTPSNEVKTKYKDGGVAIIEQIICSHGRYFIGTYERFPPETTFNAFCGEGGECPQPSVWKIVY